MDAVNYLFQFLFQELKDSSRLRRYIMHKLNTEFKELQNSRTGKIFLQNIVVCIELENIFLLNTDVFFRYKISPLVMNVQYLVIFDLNDRNVMNVR